MFPRADGCWSPMPVLRPKANRSSRAPSPNVDEGATKRTPNPKDKHPTWKEETPQCKRQAETPSESPFDPETYSDFYLVNNHKNMSV